MALAATIAAFANYGILSWRLGRDPMGRLGSARLGETFVKCVAATVVSVGGGWAAYWGLETWLGVPDSMLGRAALLLPILALIAAAYFLTAHALRVPDSDRALELVRRKLGMRRKEE